ncbi:MAG: glutaredoxin family protein [Gammaproteobacteria bacterium]|nr:glutaredoxin family protein [Gammaproteobacteria bacterium]
MPELLFYTTAGCHLCECAEAMLADLAKSRAFKLTPIDIGESAALVERYGLQIPVVRNPQTGQECNWPFNPEQVAELLHSDGSRPEAR